MKKNVIRKGILCITAVLLLAVIPFLLKKTPANDTKDMRGKATLAPAAEGTIRLKAGEREVNVSWEDNPITRLMYERLLEGPVTVSMAQFDTGPSGYLEGFPLHVEELTAVRPGDLVMAADMMLTVPLREATSYYYVLGHFADLNEAEVKKLFGNGNITVTLYLE
ncbi:MAG: hypothetical protein J5845_06355 [Lachnospiraceae bacterium]|nr:hypothetical protein [Lachnospiraceae bacterium]